MPELTYNKLKLQYDAKFYTQVQLLNKIRMQKYTQSQMAEYCGCSLRTIQKFESYNCLDSFILFVYKKILL